MKDVYLIHYGVKGMKWGVRNDIHDLNPIRRTKNVLKYGWKKGHGINVYDRIKNVNKQGNRISRMTESQKQSLSNATKYWKNRAEGKGIRESGQRNIIKRSYDSSRSFSANVRIGNSIINGLSMSMKQQSISGLSSIPGSVLGDEIINRLLGHF